MAKGMATASPEIAYGLEGRLIDMTEAICVEARDDNPSVLQRFRHNALLAGIGDHIYRRLEDKIHVVEYRPDEVIFEENEPGSSLFLIAEGSVKISKKGRASQQETLA